MPLDHVFLLVSDFSVVYLLLDGPKEGNKDEGECRSQNGSDAVDVGDGVGVEAAVPEDVGPPAIEGLGGRGCLVLHLHCGLHVLLELRWPRDGYLAGDDAHDLNLVEEVTHQHRFALEHVYISCRLQISFDRLYGQETLQRDAKKHA